MSWQRFLQLYQTANRFKLIHSTIYSVSSPPFFLCTGDSHRADCAVACTAEVTVTVQFGSSSAPSWSVAPIDFIAGKSGADGCGSTFFSLSNGSAGTVPPFIFGDTFLVRGHVSTSIHPSIHTKDHKNLIDIPRRKTYTLSSASAHPPSALPHSRLRHSR